VGTPEGKRALGRPRRRWVDNGKMITGARQMLTHFINQTKVQGIKYRYLHDMYATFRA
jgi:hypothetical protein